MFKQQRKAVGYLSRQQLGLFKLKMRHAGYEDHNGMKVQRGGEILSMRAAFDGSDGLRQNHVQVVERGDVLAVYAHTEPHTERFIDHALSAMNDEASFSGGSKMLRNDLEAAGFRLKTHAKARADAKRQR